MAYAHVAHDCEIGNYVILANSVHMGGHVVIGDHASVGGVVAIHQFTRIGCHAMIGGGYRAVKDVPPFALAAQEPLAFQGINAIGLRRRNFSQETIDCIEKAYHYIYYSHLNISQGVARIKKDLPMTEEIKEIVKFIEQSKRGIIWSRR
jgi:UDP-N-acetylglucosamine acyltransferase